MTDNEQRPREGEYPPMQLEQVVPDFEAKTTHGMLRLSEYGKDKWVVLFCHPADFTPVCTTEFMALAQMKAAMDERNVALLGSSIDSIFSHIAWVRNIKDTFGVDINFPIIADIDMKVARLFGMIHRPSSDTATVRAVFFIDPARKLRAMIHYPLTVGRSFDEILRVVDALQTVDQHNVFCPADWQPGEKAFLPPPTTTAEADERVREQKYAVSSWYFAKRSIPGTEDDD